MVLLSILKEYLINIEIEDDGALTRDIDLDRSILHHIFSIMKSKTLNVFFGKKFLQGKFINLL